MWLAEAARAMRPRNDEQYQDFYIDRISSTAQTELQSWNVLRDRVFTALGGCEEQVVSGTEGLWAFDTSNAITFLHLATSYAVVQPGGLVSTTITQTDGNGAAESPAAGAKLAGVAADGNGSVAFTAPTEEGCYQYKAEKSGAIRSQTFYLSVVRSL